MNWSQVILWSGMPAGFSGSGSGSRIGARHPSDR
jgi:hypothetical protein